MATSPSPVLDLQRMLEDPAIANDPIAVQAIMTQIQAANHNIALWGGPYKVVDEGDHVTEYYPD
jgi:hypothetical protein